ncbi:hypothetical protein HZH68_004193 [Vespula germanica]|uniref:Uncharacterized protein n=1 Tax=Vespula germanica TaxID=30212 RepID=A0A834KPR8_VESGE|nr:hypothetical protein HZH68_004193 [Vespula germanica]
MDDNEEGREKEEKEEEDEEEEREEKEQEKEEKKTWRKSIRVSPSTVIGRQARSSLFAMILLTGQGPLSSQSLESVKYQTKPFGKFSTCNKFKADVRTYFNPPIDILP